MLTSMSAFPLVLRPICPIVFATFILILAIESCDRVIKTGMNIFLITSGGSTVDSYAIPNRGVSLCR